jgi:Ca2+-binding RTX toxin-like protein
MAFNLSALTAKQQAAAIYIGYYDRAPDPYGMDFWEAAVANPVVPLVDIATYFAAQEETYAVHPFFVEPSAAAANAFISELYLNLFNRTPDAAGLEFWSTVLQGSIAGTNGFSVGEIILEIIQGAQNTAAGQDITTLLNKIEVANAWTAGAIEAGLTEPNSYGDSEIAQNSAKSIINDVTSDASSVAAAEAVIVTAFDGLFPGVTVDLTPNADIVELTRGSDTVTGVVLELSIGDTIIDPSNTDADVLNVELIEDIASNVTVQNIETVVLNALSGEREIRVTNWDGVQTYQVIGEGDVTLTDVQTTDPSYEFNGTVGTNITVGINDLATTGLADEVSVELSNGVAGGTFMLTPATTVETIRVISNGTAENVITDIIGANVRTLIVEGDAAFENANAFASTITTIDARNVSTADIHSAGATTILTGAGNDLITLGRDSALTNSSAIVMGAGTDRFDMMNSTGGAQAELIGMETIKTLDAADTNIDMAKATATPEFNVAGGSTSITLSNLINGTSLRTSDLSTSGNISIGYRNSASDAALVVDLETQHNGADDAITLTNVSDVTLNVQNGLYAVGGGAAPTVTLDDTSLLNGVVSDVVKSVTINNIGVATNGTDNVVLGDIASSSRVETLNLNATGAAVTVGTIAEAEALTSLNIDSTGGEVTVGAIGGAAASTGLSSINVAATEDVFLGAVAANNVGGVSNVTLAAANGDITGLVLTNDAGNIDTVTLSGGGSIAATFNTVLLGSGTAGSTRAINSTNTGSVNLTVSNAAASGAGTVVTLGDGSNTVTLRSSMNDNVTGGAGSDTVILGVGAGSSFGTNTIDLGTGTDVLSFDVAGVAETAGIIINVGSTAAFLNGTDGGTANSDEIVNALTAYGRSGDDGNIGSGVTTFANAERFVGTDQADVMISGSTGANMNGAAGDDVINGGTGGDTITGGEGRDTIQSGDGNDTINVTSMAADGMDVIDGGDGNADTLVVAAGAAMEFIVDDTRLTNVENITVSQGASINLTGQTEAFAITGAGGAETIIGGNAVDTVLAGLGNDVLIGGIGADVLDGQAGVDTVSYADVTLATSHGLAGITGMTVDLTAGTGTYIGVAGTTDTLRNIEAVIGSALNDVVVLGNGGMSASGEAGNDTITAGIGADTVDGGTGNDVILVTNLLQHGAGDIVTGGGGTDVIRYTAGDGGTLTLQAAVTGVEEVEISDAAGGNAGVTTESINASALTAGITLTGNDGANTLTGTAFADNFAAGGGNDTIVADGADTVDGGAGTDVMTLAADATFTDARLSNVETITLASDVDVTLDYRDTAAFQGGTGAVSSVTGVSGGAVENLNVVGSTSAGVVINNIFTGVTTTNATLNYQGGSDAEYVRATGSSDVVLGGGGADTISGEAGADVLTGGSGSDTFMVANTYSTTQFDTVTDFTAGDTTVANSQADFVNVTSANLVAGAVAQTNFGSAVTRTDGVTIQSFSIAIGGTVSLFDENVGTGTTEVFAETAADVLAVANALVNQQPNQTVVFRLDSDGNGVADSSVVVSEHADGVEIIQLNGVSAVAAGLTATGAGGTIAVTETNLLLGSDAADLLRGGDGIDTITGNGGNDTIEGGADTAVDVLTGGLGDDVYVYSGTADLVAANAVIDTITETLGGGTDAIRLDGATTLVAADNLDRASNIESITASATDGVLSLQLHADAFADGFRTVDLSGDTNALGANVIDIAAVTGIGATGMTLTGSAGVDTITSAAASAVTIQGGGGADVITLGAAGTAERVIVTAGDTGVPTATNFEQITTWTTAEDIIDYGDTLLTLVAEGSAAAAGQAQIAATGLVTFNAADTTIAQQIAAVEAGMTAATAVAGETAVFAVAGTPADSFIFISDGVAGVGENDVLIRIVGDAAGALTITGGDITAMA